MGRSLNENLLNGTDPPTLAQYERASHEHFMRAFAEDGKHRHYTSAVANEHMELGSRYKAIARRLRFMGRN